MSLKFRVSLYAATCVLATALAASSTSYAHEAHAAAAKQQVRTAKASETDAALRDLWGGHVFWVRNVVLATFDKNDEAAKAAEQQVVANAQSIAAAIEPYYGASAKEALFKLLAAHYGGVKAYLMATDAGDRAAQSAAIQNLTSNADEIATFLSKANPNLPKDAVNGLLLAHASHHVAQIQQLAGRQYDAEAKTWEEMKQHMYAIADAMTDALVKQFAKRF